MSHIYTITLPKCGAAYYSNTYLAEETWYVILLYLTHSIALLIAILR